MNFSSTGQVVEFLRKAESKGPLSCDTVLKIFYQTCRAVQHMHKQKPPIIHRDLKVQNPKQAERLIYAKEELCYESGAAASSKLFNLFIKFIYCLRVENE